jgi:ribosomal protein S18 acetylase RimI-like enzyme
VSSPATIEPATVGDLAVVRRLIEEYCRWIDVDLVFQEIGAELDGLPGDYAPPTGQLLVARLAGHIVGLVAYRRLDDRICEMKRLYVVDAARGRGLARALVVALLARAAANGYQEVRLDTLPGMGPAQRLYESLGFADIPPYYDTPIPGTRFMARGLGAWPG